MNTNKKSRKRFKYAIQKNTLERYIGNIDLPINAPTTDVERRHRPRSPRQTTLPSFLFKIGETRDSNSNVEESTSQNDEIIILSSGASSESLSPKQDLRSPYLSPNKYDRLPAARKNATISESSSSSMNGIASKYFSPDKLNSPWSMEVLSPYQSRPKSPSSSVRYQIIIPADSPPASVECENMSPDSPPVSVERWNMSPGSPPVSVECENMSSDNPPVSVECENKSSDNPQVSVHGKNMSLDSNSNVEKSTAKNDEIIILSSGSSSESLSPKHNLRSRHLSPNKYDRSPAAPGSLPVSVECENMSPDSPSVSVECENMSPGSPPVSVERWNMSPGSPPVSVECENMSSDNPQVSVHGENMSLDSNSNVEKSTAKNDEIIILSSGSSSESLSPKYNLRSRSPNKYDRSPAAPGSLPVSIECENMSPDGPPVSVECEIMSSHSPQVSVHGENMSLDSPPPVKSEKMSPNCPLSVKSKKMAPNSPSLAKSEKMYPDSPSLVKSEKMSPDNLAPLMSRKSSPISDNLKLYKKFDISPFEHKIPKVEDILRETAESKRQKEMMAETQEQAKIFMRQVEENAKNKKEEAKKKEKRLNIKDCKHITLKELDAKFREDVGLLDAIFYGLIYNERHERFKEDSVLYNETERDMRINDSNAVFTSNQLLYIVSLFRERYDTGSNLLQWSDYYFKVLLPEYCTKIFMDVYNMNYDEAQTYFKTIPDEAHLIC